MAAGIERQVRRGVRLQPDRVGAMLSAKSHAAHHAVADAVPLEEHGTTVFAEIFDTVLVGSVIETDPLIADDEEIAGNLESLPQVAYPWSIQSMFTGDALQHDHSVLL